MSVVIQDTLVDLGTADLKPATPLSHRNLIINGGMRVYQRNASNSTSGKYVADRFKNEFSGAGVTTSREDLSSGEPYNKGFRHFIRNTNTSTSSATSAYVYHVYHIEAQDLVNSGWNYTSSSSYMTLQFWVRSSLAGTYYVVMETQDGSPNKTYSFSYTVSANTWTKVKHSFPGDSGITINNDNGSGLRINFVAYLGTDYSTSSHTNNAWQTLAIGDLVGDFAQNWANTSSATFDVTGVQLERGSVATPFEHRSYGEELQRCQRYFESCRGSFRCSPTGNYIGAHGAFKVTKRASPSCVFGANGSVAGSGSLQNFFGADTEGVGMQWNSGSANYNYNFSFTAEAEL